MLFREFQLVVTCLCRWQCHEYDYEPNCARRKLIELSYSVFFLCDTILGISPLVPSECCYAHSRREYNVQSKESKRSKEETRRYKGVKFDMPV